VLDLSIAHAGERVVVAVARGTGVGVDVEPIGPFEDLTGAAAGVLAPAERAGLAALPVSARPPCSFATGRARRRC
jgi:phosphopantetheinyl transferase